MVIWVTGISGAGKTTVCQELVHVLKKDLPQTVLLDGDVIRDAFGNDLGYAEAARKIQIQRIQRLAKALSDQDLVVVVAALYAHPDLLAWNRENIQDYYEVYIDAPLDLVRERDPKGLYAKVAAGTMPDVVGIDIPWHAPEQPDLVIDARQPDSPQTIAQRLAEMVPFLKRPMETDQT